MDDNNNNKQKPLSRKELRAAALATLKSRRSGTYYAHDTSTATTSTSALDSYDANAVDDAYDEMNDEEYRKRVENNRAREDFVVDDGEFVSILFLGFRVLLLNGACHVIFLEVTS